MGLKNALEISRERFGGIGMQYAQRKFFNSLKLNRTALYNSQRDFCFTDLAV
jgi:hypothetical protein